MTNHKCEKVKGFWLRSNDFIAENGSQDGDDEVYFAGETLEEAFENLIHKCEYWYCNDCEQAFSDKDEASEHEEDYKE